ncbi:MAG: uracil-DNA glycosylase family protein [Mycobacterium leprae]
MKTGLHQFFREAVPQLLAAAKSEGIHLSRYSWPHVPYVGADYEAAPLRVLLVGRAAVGWGIDPLSSLNDFVIDQGEALERALLLSDQFMARVTERFAGGGGYYSPFWHRAYALLSSLLDGADQVTSKYDRQRSERTFRSIAWTNLFKIGLRDDNPDESMTSLLKSQANWLERELELLKPGLVLFSTGTAYDHHLTSMLPFRWGPESGKVTRLYLNGQETPVIYRTPHLQALTRDEMDDFYPVLRRSLLE